MTDQEIAKKVTPRPIHEIAGKLNIPDGALIPYGKIKAKIDTRMFAAMPKKARLILTTAINPTPAGEGKTTVTIGLADALRKLGKNAAAVLREPSLGPVFGVKGGAAGGGWAQVTPMEDINLHFNGDLHAITTANNLLSAMLDNSLSQGNPLRIDSRTVTFRRCMDMNDRQLRNIVCGLGGTSSGVPREDGFDITAASEVMACFCLAKDLKDLKARLERIEVARDFDKKPVTAGQLGAAGAMCALLRDAFSPNLVQTLEGSPAIIHGGPFANIAHGCNSVAATELALKLSDIAVTEAGFGADLGCEKFIDIKCRMNGLVPDCVVIVATVRALKYHGGVDKDKLNDEDVSALKKGLPNLIRHIDNVQSIWNRPAVVAINRFPSDTLAEINAVEAACAEHGSKAVLTEVWGKGGEGGTALAEAVLAELDKEARELEFTYALDIPLTEKIETLAARVYGAANVAYASGVKTRLLRIDRECKADGAGGVPICIAKTQYSFSDDPTKRGAPEPFTLTVRDVKYSRGAGFVVVFAGEIIAMPGLPKVPAAVNIDVDDDGEITGIF
ncbi:MAG: formate--tetrahydrofolate ligase [Oscillospiraceae bacterium]|jgi:formate--tetrahydrofolate ligase|nr:formate--tetrahydrofolate ligase [Oscillospiraceae bacterium]